MRVSYETTYDHPPLGTVRGSYASRKQFRCQSSGPDASFAPAMTSQASMQPDERGLDAVGEIARRLIENLETVVHGKSTEIRLVLSGLLAGGHVLLEDVPGT